MEKEIVLSNGKTVKMREPKVRDMKISLEAKTEAEQEIKLIGNLTNLTPDEMDDLSFKDYTSLQKALKGFL